MKTMGQVLSGGPARVAVSDRLPFQIAEPDPTNSLKGSNCDQSFGRPDQAGAPVAVYLPGNGRPTVNSLTSAPAIAALGPRGRVVPSDASVGALTELRCGRGPRGLINETGMPLLLVAVRQGLHRCASTRLPRQYRSPVLDLLQRV